MCVTSLVEPGSDWAYLRRHRLRVLHMQAGGLGMSHMRAKGGKLGISDVW